MLKILLRWGDRQRLVRKRERDRGKFETLY